MKTVAHYNGVQALEAMAIMDSSSPEELFQLSNIPMDRYGIITFTAWDLSDIVAMVEYHFTKNCNYKETVYQFIKFDIDKYIEFVSNRTLQDITSSEELSGLTVGLGEVIEIASLLSSNLRKVPTLSKIVQEARLDAAEDLSVASLADLDTEKVKEEAAIGTKGEVSPQIVSLIIKRADSKLKRAEALERGSLNGKSNSPTVNLTQINNTANLSLPQTIEELEKMSTLKLGD